MKIKSYRILSTVADLLIGFLIDIIITIIFIIIIISIIINTWAKSGLCHLLWANHISVSLLPPLKNGK